MEGCWPELVEWSMHCIPPKIRVIVASRDLSNAQSCMFESQNDVCDCPLHRTCERGDLLHVHIEQREYRAHMYLLEIASRIFSVIHIDLCMMNCSRSALPDVTTSGSHRKRLEHMRFPDTVGEGIC